MAKTYDYLFKLLLIGDSGVGKTCVLFRFSEDAFNTTFISTIGIDFKIRTIELDGKKIKLQIWDTAGQERFRTITTAYYRGAMGIMLVYDITNEKSFENIKNWIRNIEENASADVEKMLLGNKCELTEKRQVTKERGEQLAIEYGIKFMETSAKASINVEDAFFTLARDIKTKMEKKLKLPGSTSHWLFSAGEFTALTPLHSPPPVVVQRGRLVTQPPPPPANTTHLPLTYIRLQSSLAFLKTDMELRFEDLTKLQIPDWILDPFSFEAVDKLDNSLQTEFLDLKYDCEAKIIFKQSGYELGWVKIMDTYPQLWGKTEPLLISFPSTYLVEKGFSSVVQLLTKQRNKLDICLKGDLRLNLTNIKPDIQALTEIHQAQGSH
uniref:Uncharacterized protein n=4 Tax=Timema TaxID=61471 RepID=A0A7R9EAP8_9NEOP|nr:unnamed protein product [Timema monikensis]